MSGTTSNYLFNFIQSGDAIATAKLPSDAQQIDTAIFQREMDAWQLAQDLYTSPLLNHTGSPRFGLDMERMLAYHFRDYAFSDWAPSGLETTAPNRYAAGFAAASSQYLSIADNSDLSTGDVDFSIALWVRPSTLPSSGNTMGLAGKWSAGNLEYLLFLDNTAGTIRFKFQVRKADDSATVTVTASTFGAPQAGQWYLVTAYHDAGNDRIGVRVNDTPADTVTIAGGVRDGTAPFEIGRHSEGNYFDGRIDSIGFWKSAPGGGGVLTGTQQILLWNNGAGLYYSGLSSQLNTAALKAWWDLDEAGGTRNDSKASNHLTSNNGVSQTVGVGASIVRSAAGYIYLAGNLVNFAAPATFSTYLSTPVNLASSASPTGGSMPAGTWQYRVTAFNSVGETLASTIATATTTGPSSSVVLTWNTVNNATGYRLYRTKSSIDANIVLHSSASALTSASYLDTTAALTTTTPVPSRNTAGVPNATYYLRAYGSASTPARYWSTTASSIGMLLATVTTDANGDVSAISDQRPLTYAWSGPTLFAGANGTSASPTFGFVSRPGLGMYSSAASTLDFATSGTDRWQIMPAGHLFAVSDGVYDIGAAAANRPRAIYTSGPVTVGGLLLSGGGLQITSGQILTNLAVSPSPNALGWLANIDGTINEAASGTHPRLSSLEVNAPNVNAGAATVTNAQTLYIGGAPTAAGAINRALWISSGNVAIGQSGEPPLPGGLSPYVQIVHGTTSDAPLTIGRSSNDTGGSHVFFYKTRATAIASHTAVASGDSIGGLRFAASDGSAAIEGARVEAVIGGSVSSGVLPTRLSVSVRDIAGNFAERLRLWQSGGLTLGSSPTVNPGAQNMHILGGLSVGETTIPSAGDIIAAGNLYLGQTKGVWGTDTSGSRILVTSLGGDNVCRVGPVSAPASNGHLLLLAAGQERVRINPTGGVSFHAGIDPGANRVHFQGGILQLTDLNASVRGRLVLVAVNQAIQVIPEIAEASGLLLAALLSSGVSAILALNSFLHSVSLISDPGGIISTTQGTADRINFYWSTANSRYEVENRRSSDQYMSLFYFGKLS